MVASIGAACAVAACVIAACGAFSGTDVSSSTSADGAPSEGGLTIDGALASDGAFGDATNGQADGGACTELLHESLTQLPAGWTTDTSDASTVTFEAKPPVVLALKAHVAADKVGEGASVHRDVTLSTVPKSVQATVSLYLSDTWAASNVELGCELKFFNSDQTKSANFAISHPPDGTITASVAADTAVSSQLYPATPPPAPGWYDATMTLAIVDGKNLLATAQLVPQGGGAPPPNTLTLPLTFTPASLHVSCGITQAYATVSTIQQLDEWVANLTVLRCD
jgi:hypothetical protein